MMPSDSCKYIQPSVLLKSSCYLTRGEAAISFNSFFFSGTPNFSVLTPHPNPSDKSTPLNTHLSIDFEDLALSIHLSLFSS